MAVPKPPTAAQAERVVRNHAKLGPVLERGGEVVFVEPERRPGKPGRVIVGVLAFFFAWISSLVVATLVLAGTGLDILTAFSAATASLCNIGPGLHQVGPSSNFAALDDVQIWICTALMLLGRLELFMVLVIFTPAFWRK